MARGSRWARAGAGRDTRRAPHRSSVGLIATLFVAIVALGGCVDAALSGFYLEESAPRAYLADEFSGWTDWLFQRRTAYGVSWEHDIRDGYLISRGPGQFLYSHEPVPAHAAVVLDWEIWYASETPQRNNGSQLDFEVMLDVSDTSGDAPFGPAVAVKFYDTATAPEVDRLELRASTETGVQTHALTRDASLDPARRAGTLTVWFDREREPARISATLTGDADGTILEGSLEVPEGWPESARVMISVFGAWDEYRVLDSVAVYPLENGPPEAIP